MTSIGYKNPFTDKFIREMIDISKKDGEIAKMAAELREQNMGTATALERLIEVYPEVQKSYLLRAVKREFSLPRVTPVEAQVRAEHGCFKELVQLTEHIEREQIDHERKLS